MVGETRTDLQVIILRGGAKPDQWFNVFTIHPANSHWTTRDTSCNPQVGRIVLDGDDPFQESVPAEANPAYQTYHCQSPRAVAKTIRPPWKRASFKRLTQRQNLQLHSQTPDPGSATHASEQSMNIFWQVSNTATVAAGFP